MSTPTAAQIIRYDKKDFPRGSLWAGACIRCGRDYASCPCNSGEVQNLARQIKALSIRDRNNILQGGPVPKTTTQSSYPTRDQVNRLDTKVRISRSLYEGTCISCGERYRDCSCTSEDVRKLANRIKALTTDERKRIMEGKPMPESAAEKADELVRKANELLQAAEALRAQAVKEATRYQYPKEPDSTGPNKFSIAVKFRGSPQWYEFLVLRVPGKGYFTTGREQGNQWFATWKDFVDWLRSDDITDNGKLCSLIFGSKEYEVP